MKSIVIGILAAGLAACPAVVMADSSTDNAGKVLGHGAGGVGHGASKLYHEAAKGVHKIIAHNTHNPHVRAAHLRKAQVHRYRAGVQARRSRKEFNRASRAANR